MPILWCDNISAGCLASNLAFHARTKHIEIDVHFIHEQVLNKTLKVWYMLSQYQVADVLTKVLSSH